MPKSSTLKHIWLLMEVNDDSEGLETLDVFGDEGRGRLAFMKILKEDMEDARLIDKKARTEIITLAKNKKYDKASTLHLETHTPCHFTFTKQELL